MSDEASEKMYESDELNAMGFKKIKDLATTMGIKFRLGANKGLLVALILKQQRILSNVTEEQKQRVDKHKREYVVTSLGAKVMQSRLIISSWVRLEAKNRFGWCPDLETMVVKFYAATGGDGDLIVSHETIELEADRHYEFDSVHIMAGGKLNINMWSPAKQGGGRLFIKCYGEFVIEKGGVVEVSGCGLKGGQGRTQPGESIYGSVEGNGTEPNQGGGGAGNAGEGGGGGFGTPGVSGYAHSNQIRAGTGGRTYGDDKITFLHLGSGGGGGHPGQSPGGNGGGCIVIVAYYLWNRGLIQCNGRGFYDENVHHNYEARSIRYRYGYNPPMGSGGGGGSGGTIFLEVPYFSHFRNVGKIEAVGGNRRQVNGRGGEGRIAVKITHSFDNTYEDDIFNFGDFNPKPKILTY